MRPGDFSVNPSYFLDAYRLTSPWVIWALRRGGLVDLHERFGKPVSPAVYAEDVLEPETLALLPRPVMLKRRPQGFL